MITFPLNKISLSFAVVIGTNDGAHHRLFECVYVKRDFIIENCDDMMRSSV